MYVCVVRGRYVLCLGAVAIAGCGGSAPRTGYRPSPPGAVFNGESGEHREQSYRQIANPIGTSRKTFAGPGGELFAYYDVVGEANGWMFCFKHGGMGRASRRPEATPRSFTRYRALPGNMSPDQYTAFRELADRGREIERRFPLGSLSPRNWPSSAARQLRDRSDEISHRVRHGARALRVFGSVARGDAGPGSDVDVLVDMEEVKRGLFDVAALQGDLEGLLGCPVHVMTVSGLRQAREHTRERIEREAVLL